MASFNFDAPTPTVGLPADCALRMRVRRSAMGSVMLIVRASPAGLRQARNFPTIGRLAQFGARQSKLAVHATRTSGDGTAVALPAGRRIARLLLQIDLRLFALLRPRLRVAGQRFSLGAPGRGIPRYLDAAPLAADDGSSRHCLT